MHRLPTKPMSMISVSVFANCVTIFLSFVGLRAVFLCCHFPSIRQEKGQKPSSNPRGAATMLPQAVPKLCMELCARKSVFLQYAPGAIGNR